MNRLRIDWHPDLKVPVSKNAKKLHASYIRGKRQVCLSGCRSSGKTSTIWPYVLGWCADVPGFTVIVARKEYSTLRDSTLESLNKHVLKYPFYDEKNNPWSVDGGMNRPQKIIFQNGSVIRLMGLRDPEQVKGQEPDIFWHNEASREQTQKAWTLISGSQTAGRGVWKRYGRSFSQIIADTNPDAPSSWLYKYFHDTDGLDPGILQRREWLDFKLKDNAAYSDDGLVLNRLGNEAYEDLLADHPPGIDRDRYVFGKWVAAEGAVLHNFDFRKDVIKELPDMRGEHWLHYRGIDFGDNAPLVCLWSSLNRDNGMLISHREWRKTQTGLDTHVETIYQHSIEKKYEWSVADSANASERRHFSEKGIETVGSRKDIKENLRLVRKRIGAGKWKIYKDLLIAPDHRLVQENKCLSILDEIGTLVYPEKKTGSPADELPDKNCERHGVDCAQYKIARLDAPQPEPAEVETDLDWTF